MIPDGYWELPGDMRVISGPQECSEDIQSTSTCEKHDFSMPNTLIPPVWARIWLRLNLGGKSMVLDRQRQLSGQPVIKSNRNHPETSFLGLKVLSGASWRV